MPYDYLNKIEFCLLSMSGSNNRRINNRGINLYI